MDEKGYIVSSLSFLLMIPAILLVFIIFTVNNIGTEPSSIAIQSKNVFYEVNDLKNNIPRISKKVINEISMQVIDRGAVNDSREVVKEKLQLKINQILAKSEFNDGLRINCTVLSVETGDDPFIIQINSTIHVSKNTVVHEENISQNISIEGLPDCLPFIVCSEFGKPEIIEDKIYYNSYLFEFLNNKNISNSEVYINATSPFLIKKCPYHPYTVHGNLLNLKNCIENGYYHESNDGACYLCRLEGKNTCPHYGIETFIIPQCMKNSTFIMAPCSIDHVLFNKTSFYGMGIDYYQNNLYYYKIFLDNGHRLKYGINH
ncbi:MAG: hypothetical protein QME14_02460 [Methanobacteriaceae archaeon]|nr:hypothetical protein [Methanobacteriaceae archaeon]